MNVLLPTLRRPTMASLSATSPGGRLAGVRRQFRKDRVEQLGLAALLLGADRNRFAVAELEELADLLTELFRVGLVRDERRPAS